MNKKKKKSYGLRADKSMQTWMQICRSFNKIRAKEMFYIQSFNVTMNQFQVLEVLYHKGDLNVSAITKLTMSTPGNITVVLKNLKRDGYINSLPNAQDKRASILSITQSGRDVIEKLFPGHAKNFEEYFKAFSIDEMETLFSLLKKLQKSQ